MYFLHMLDTLVHQVLNESLPAPFINSLPMAIPVNPSSSVYYEFSTILLARADGGNVSILKPKHPRSISAVLFVCRLINSSPSSCISVPVKA